MGILLRVAVCGVHAVTITLAVTVSIVEMREQRGKVYQRGIQLGATAPARHADAVSVAH